MSVYAIIPARGGSKGLPGKNCRTLEGFPLIAYSIAAAKLSNKIDRIIISTDSEEIANISRLFDAEVPFLRPDVFARDTSTDLEFMLHAIQWFEEKEEHLPEYWVHLRPTTPLRDPELIDDAIEKFSKNDVATSLRSAHECPESPFKWFLLKEDGYFKGLQTDEMDFLNQARQSFPPVFVPDGYVDVLKTQFIQKSQQMHGGKVQGYISPFCCEVDTIDDFERIAYLLQKDGSILLDYLKNNYGENML